MLIGTFGLDLKCTLLVAPDDGVGRGRIQKSKLKLLLARQLYYYMHSSVIEHMTIVLLAPCSTT